jgi:hypothetical protein
MADKNDKPQKSFDVLGCFFIGLFITIGMYWAIIWLTVPR